MVNGQYVPEIDVVTTVYVQCNMVNQGLVSMLPNLMYSFTPGNTGFGALITVQPPQRDWFPVVDGNYSFVDLTLTDQTGQQIALNDPVWNATLLLEQVP